MNRRQFISTFAVSLSGITAGCTSGSSNTNSTRSPTATDEVTLSGESIQTETQTSTESPTQTATSDNRQLETGRGDTFVTDANLAITIIRVEMLAANDGMRTVHVKVTVENQAEEPRSGPSVDEFYLTTADARFNPSTEAPYHDATRDIGVDEEVTSDIEFTIPDSLVKTDLDQVGLDQSDEENVTWSIVCKCRTNQ